jgi:replicative DNA helicase
MNWNGGGYDEEYELSSRPARDRAKRARDREMDDRVHALERELDSERAANQHYGGPVNLEAESALLGALLIDNEVLDFTAVRLRAEHFFLPVHGAIYEQIRLSIEAGRRVTPVTLRPYFEHDEALLELGGVSYLARLTGDGAGLLMPLELIDQIVDLAILRQMVGATRQIVDRTMNIGVGGLDSRNVLREAESMFADIAADNELMQTHTVDASAAWDECVDEIEAVEKGRPIAGITIAGYEDWNDVVGRMEEGDFILLGGRPSMGKTGVACAVAVGAAAAGHATEFLSLEMTRRRIMRRVVANEIFEHGESPSYNALNEGRLTPLDWERIRDARAKIAEYPLGISDPTQMNVEDVVGFIRARARVWARRGQTLKLVVIDYLSRLGTAKPFRTETEQTSYISRKLKEAAKITGVALVVLTQLSRDVEKRDDKRPHLADLRQSGSLEQDADVVAFVYRDEYYLIRSEPPKTDPKKWEPWHDALTATRDRLELYATKRREGELLKRTGYFYAGYQAIRSSAYAREGLSRAQGDFGGWTDMDD